MPKTGSAAVGRGRIATNIAVWAILATINAMALAPGQPGLAGGSDVSRAVLLAGINLGVAAILIQRERFDLPFGSFLCAASFLAAYALLKRMLVVGVSTDFAAHIRWAERFSSDEGGKPAHFLFHVMIVTLSRTTGLALDTSAVLTTAGATAASAAIVFHVYLRDPRSPSRSGVWLRVVLTVVALTATAIYLPWFNRIYLGQSSPTAWHSPTILLLKPFALISAHQLACIVFGRPGWPTYGGFAASVLVGMLAKPALALPLIPLLIAIVALLSVPSRWISYYHVPASTSTRNVLIGLIFAMVFLLTWQTWHIYGGPAESSIVIAPFKVWLTWTPSIPVSILITVAFPLAASVLDLVRGVELRALALAWLLYGAALVIACLFAESGNDFESGNFFWSYQITLAILFACSVQSYLRHCIRPRLDWAFAGTTLVLLLHGLSGAYYPYQILVYKTYF